MRKTVASETILKIINASEVALSQADIQAILPDGLCNRVTIYRVLDRLVEEQLIHQVTNIDGVVNYANCRCCSKEHKHQHVHFNCEKCKSVTCIDDVEPSFKLPAQYQVNTVNFMVSGLCPDCKSSLG